MISRMSSCLGSLNGSHDLSAKRSFMAPPVNDSNKTEWLRNLFELAGQRVPQMQMRTGKHVSTAAVDVPEAVKPFSHHFQSVICRQLPADRPSVFGSESNLPTRGRSVSYCEALMFSPPLHNLYQSKSWIWSGDGSLQPIFVEPALYPDSAEVGKQCNLQPPNGDCKNGETCCTSRQSSSIDSGNHSDETAINDNVVLIERQSTVSRSSSKIRVAHVITLRGRYAPARVRVACCCYPVRRPFHRRRVANDRQARSTRHSCRSRSVSRSRTDSSSTCGMTGRFVHSFAFLPSSESELGSANQSEDDESSPWESEVQVQTISSDGADLESFFFSFGLINIGVSSGSFGCFANISEKKAKSSSCGRNSAAARSGEQFEWTEQDRRSWPNGLSYTYSLSGTPISEPPETLVSRLQGLRKPTRLRTSDSSTTTDSHSERSPRRLSCKKVRFAKGVSLKRVRPLCAWHYWSHRARQDEFLQRKARFDFLIRQYTPLLCSILSTKHRDRVFQERFSEAEPVSTSKSDSAQASPN